MTATNQRIVILLSMKIALRFYKKTSFKKIFMHIVQG